MGDVAVTAYDGANADTPGAICRYAHRTTGTYHRYRPTLIAAFGSSGDLTPEEWDYCLKAFIGHESRVGGRTEEWRAMEVEEAAIGIKRWWHRFMWGTDPRVNIEGDEQELKFFVIANGHARRVPYKEMARALGCGVTQMALF
jgi:hypothetical protein